LSKDLIDRTEAQNIGLSFKEEHKDFAQKLVKDSQVSHIFKRTEEKTDVSTVTPHQPEGLSVLRSSSQPIIKDPPESTSESATSSHVSSSDSTPSNSWSWIPPSKFQTNRTDEDVIPVLEGYLSFFL
jgi:hypothetical protein